MDEAVVAKRKLVSKIKLEIVEQLFEDIERVLMELPIESLVEYYEELRSARETTEADSRQRLIMRYTLDRRLAAPEDEAGPAPAASSTNSTSEQRWD